MSPSLKYQSESIQKQLTGNNSTGVAANVDPNFNAAHRAWKNIKIVVPLKYISNFFRNLELPLINTKLCMELKWTKNLVLSTTNQNSILQITKGELYIPVVTLNKENNIKLIRLLSEGFERPVIWNGCKSKIERINIPQTDNSIKRTTLDTCFQSVSRILVAAYKTDNTKRNIGEAESRTRYYLPREEIKDYNVLIDGKKFL